MAASRNEETGGAPASSGGRTARLLVAAVVALSAGFVALSLLADGPSAAEQVEELNRANGLVEGAPDGRCAGAWEVPGAAICTHGVDLLTDLAPESRSTVVRPSGRAITCIGDGASGPRVQMLYVRPSDRASRLSTVRPTIQAWATHVDDVMAKSAAKTGGIRRVRWVHGGSCEVTVTEVVLPAATNTFTQIVTELRSRGFSATDRKYVVAWDDDADASRFCGTGSFLVDSTAGAGNDNETQPTGSLFAAVDAGAGCWVPDLVAHEIMHTFGAVQADAPNATAFGHCDDESDIMCYTDGPGSVMRTVCSTGQETLYDCRNDDYFHTDPPPGSYLATRWNPAGSRFLDATDLKGPPGVPTGVGASAATASVSVSWSPPELEGGSGVIGYVVTARPSGRTVSVGASARTATVAGLADGVVTSIEVQAVNRQGAGQAVVVGDLVPSPPVRTLLTDRVTPVRDLARGPAGSVYVARVDRIERIAADGTVTTVVGGGTVQNPPAEGTAPLATAVSPGALTVEADGDLVFWDQQSRRVRRLQAGVVTTIAGNGVAAYRGDGGPALDAALAVTDLEVLPDGSVLVLDQGAHVVRRFVIGGSIARVAGTLDTSGAPIGDGGSALSARFTSPSDLAVQGSTVFVADFGAHRVRRFTVGGTITTVAGNGTLVVADDRTLPATGTGVPFPSTIDVASDVLHVADATRTVRRLVGTSLVRQAGSRTATVGTDGTVADAVAWGGLLDDLLWSGGTLHVVVNELSGPSLVASRLRAAGPWASAAPAVAPSAPAAAIAVGGAGSATVSWVPAGNGGGALTGYVVTPSGGGTPALAGPGATSLSVTGLTPGTSYTFAVAAVNGVGTGPSRTTNAVVPTAPPPYAPFSSWSALVRQQFLDLLDRPPTASESSSWVSQLSGETTTPADLVVSLRRSSDHTSFVDPVARLYRAYLLRTPDAPGLEFWVDQRRGGRSLRSISDFFAGSREFTTRYGALSNAQFISLIYEQVLERPSEPTGFDFWVAELSSGRRSRGTVMIGFSESSEYKAKYAPLVDVSVAYVMLLGRAPTNPERDEWITRQRAGTPVATLVAEVLGSAEYATSLTT